jgi:hypothetical protein
VLVIAAMAVTSADAADVIAASHAEPACAAQSAPTKVVMLPMPTGRMPVRGMQHLAAVYAQGTASSDDATSYAGDQATAPASAGKART